MPLISVIMPSYNHQRFIGEAMESVLGQSVGDLELIVVDDASADGSRGVIESYQARDGRIRAFFHDTNQDIARTVNQAFAQAQGQFVAFLASDDVWAEDKLQRQLEVLWAQENLVVCSNIMAIDAEGKSTGQDLLAKLPLHGVVPGEQVFSRLLHGNFIYGQTMILKRRSLEGLRYDEQLKYMNDWKFAIDLASRYDFYFMPECLAKYRVHGGNTISRDASGWLRDYALLGEHILANHTDRLSPRAKAMFMYRIGCHRHGTGDLRGGRAWMAKAIAADPFKSEYYLGVLSSFRRRGILPRSLRRKIPSG
jgi:glycosyltransferase involved in cell wall biosynthesis